MMDAFLLETFGYGLIISATVLYGKVFLRMNNDAMLKSQCVEAYLGLLNALKVSSMKY